MRSVPKDTDVILEQRTKRALRRLLDLREEIQEIEAELEILMNKRDQILSTASSCGTVIAAEIGDINRFHSPAALAKYAGCAPRECSSGKKTKWRKTRSGNRRLNRTFHRTALSQYPGRATMQPERTSKGESRKAKLRRKL